MEILLHGNFRVENYSWKNFLERFSRFEKHQQATQRSVETISSEESREQRLKKTEQSFRDLWVNIRFANINIRGLLEGEEREKGLERIFLAIMAENFKNWWQTWL